VGTLVGMRHPHRWSLELEIREDAESVFIPAELLPHAEVGDLVEITSGSASRRRGHLIERVQDDVRGRFVTVKFDATTAGE
jgi:hypothetical protein